MSDYRITALARHDLLHIHNYIAEQSPGAAAKVLNEIEGGIEQIVFMPGIGHRRNDVRDERYRVWSVYSFLIIYDISTVPLTVVRVVHGARELRKIFRGRTRT